MPFLEREDGRFAADGALWNMVVVQLQIVQQSGLQVGPAIETGLLKQLVDAPVESLNHAVGLRVARRCQAMFGGQSCAGDVESMLAAGFLVFGGETVSKLRAVVGEDLADLDGRSQLEPTQEIDAARLGHVAVDVHENPARRTVDGDEQVASRGLVRHLRQVLDVDVDEAGFVVLEGLLRRDRLSLRRRN